MLPHLDDPTTPTGQAESGQNSGDGTVLVVDDTPDKRQLLETLLRHSGYRVLTAGDGSEGLDAARAARPDLIISDVAMPVMDGIELCRRVRAEDGLRLTPLLLVSAMRKDSDSVTAGLLAGADDYIEAPYDPMRLVAKIARLMERKRAEELFESVCRLVGPTGMLTEEWDPELNIALGNTPQAYSHLALINAALRLGAGG